MRTKFSGILTLLLVFAVQLVFAQQKTVSGTVTDVNATPLPGVSVIIKGTVQGTQTDFDGNFSIEVASTDVLVFEYIGLEAQEVPVGNKTQINVTMQEGSEDLAEVLVVGYGTTTKESFVGSAKQVEGEILSQKNFSNVSQALAGEVAGVTVINTSGQPGTTSAIRIRGFGSVNGNRAPLYVVDGIPFSGSINSINPNDIKSTTVLKDATATAIYGSRGANGVILIETKSGTSKEGFVEVDIRRGVNTQIIPRYNVMTSPEEYIGAVWEGLYNRALIDGLPQGLALNQANNNLFSPNVVPAGYNMWDVPGNQLIDPVTGTVREGVARRFTPERYADVAFSSAFRDEANLRMGGGNERTRYFFSSGMLDEEGVSLNTSYKRYTTRVNLDSDIKDWLNVKANIGYAYSESLQNGQTNGAENIFEFADKMAPIFPVFLRDDEGQLVADPIFGGNQYDFGTPSGFRARPNANLLNPIASALYDFVGFDRHEVNASFNTTVKLSDNLQFESNVGAQYANTISKTARNPFYGTAAEQGGSLFQQNSETFVLNALQLLRYKKSFGDHNLEALVAHETNAFEQNFMFASKNLGVVYGIYELNNYLEIGGQPGGFTNRRTLESYFGQLNYDFDKKYFLSASVRRDGSSRFANNKWDTFGAIGASWILSKEDFFNVKAIEYLKIKTSWGISGDEAGVGFYTGLDTYNAQNLDGSFAFALRSVADPNLTWETSYMYQAGLESNLFGWLDVNLDYYIKDTQNLIFARRLPVSTGVSTITTNDGVLRNQGFEFDLNAQLVNTPDFGLNVAVNGQLFDNQITTMPIDPSTGQPALLNRTGRFAFAQGGSIFDYYMREYAGVDPADGAPLWYQYFDANTGDPIQSMTPFLNENPDAEVDRRITRNYEDATDKFVGKSAIPDVSGAFRINARYKNLTLSTQFTYQIGGYGYDSQYSELMTDRFGAAGNNFHTDMRDRWRQPGDITSVPRLADGLDQNASSTSTRFLTRSDFFAFNNFNVAYEFPKKILANTPITRLNVYFTGDNIFINSARDGFFPNTSESGFSGRGLYAPLTTFTLGVNCTL